MSFLPFGENLDSISAFQAFHPQPLHPDTAHTALPIQIGKDASKQGRKRARVQASEICSMLVVPDMPRLIADIKAIGLGLVADVRLKMRPEP